MDAGALGFDTGASSSPWPRLQAGFRGNIRMTLRPPAAEHPQRQIAAALWLDRIARQGVSVFTPHWHQRAT
jgi:hypothetical protein